MLANTVGIGKRAVMNLLGERTYYTARAYRHFWSQHRQRKALLFVHQMGKVGSTTVVNSLYAQPTLRNTTIYQTHFLSDAGIAFVEQLEEAGHGGWSALTTKTKGFLATSRVLGQQFRAGAWKDRPCKVITLVRDPIATNLSGFFYNNAWWPLALHEQCARQAPGYLTALLDHFLHHYPHDVPLTWFDMEMKGVFGVDVFAEPFALEQGYQIYRSGRTALLLLKLEQLNHAAQPAFHEFMGLADFQLVRKNEASDKSYAEVYGAFMAQLCLPEAYIRRMYDSQFMRHFYSPQEIAAFEQKWTPINKGDAR